MSSRQDNRADSHDIHFWVSDIVPDNEVHLSYVVKDPATPQNTILVTDHSTEIIENIGRYESWRKYPIKIDTSAQGASELIVDDAVTDAAHIYGTPENVINSTFPIAGCRYELREVIQGAPPEAVPVYINSAFYYAVSKDMTITSVIVHLTPSGQMPSAFAPYQNPGENFAQYIYDPVVDVQILLQKPDDATALFIKDETIQFRRKPGGTHIGSYNLAFSQEHACPSGSQLTMRFHTKTCGPWAGPLNRAGYVLFLEVSNYVNMRLEDPTPDPGLLPFRNDPINEFRTAVHETNHNANWEDCPSRYDGAFFVGTSIGLNAHRCGGGSGLPHIEVVDSRFVETSGFSAFYVDTDANGIPLPVDPIMKDPRLDVTNDTINADNPSRPDIPLGWEYLLKYDHKAYTTSIMDGITIMNENGRIVPETNYQANRELSYDTDPIFDDVSKIRLLLPSNLARIPGETFQVRYNKYLNGGVQTNFAEVINPLRRSVNGRDYIIDFGYTNPRLRVTTGGNLAEASTLTGEEFLWVKISDDSKVFVAPPIANPHHAWYPRVHIGGFKQFDRQVQTSDGTRTKDLLYWMPESRNQPAAVNWGRLGAELAASGIPRLEKFIKERLDIVDPITLRTRHNSIYFWETDKGLDEGHFDLAILGWPDYEIPNMLDFHLDGGSFFPDDPNDVREAKHSHGLTLYKNGQLLPNTIIRDWDFFNGLIFLNEPINYDDHIEATYLAEQEWVIGRSLDLNPTTTHPQASQVNKPIRIVLKPHWNTYLEDTHDPEPSGYKLAWHYLDDNATGEYNATWDIGGTLNAGSTIGNDFTRPNEIVGLPDGTIVLGDVVIRQHVAGSATLLDARIRGGGIKSDDWFVKQEKIRTRLPNADPRSRGNRQRESKFYWDIGNWDGEAYQGDAVLVIQLPISIRTTFHDNIVDERVATTRILPEDIDLVDQYFINNGEYNFKNITNGIIATEKLRSIRDYIDLQREAWFEADEEVHRLVNKYIALGTFYVLMDERGELWPQVQSSPTYRRLR